MTSPRQLAQTMWMPPATAQTDPTPSTEVAPNEALFETEMDIMSRSKSKVRAGGIPDSYLAFWLAIDPIPRSARTAVRLIYPRDVRPFSPHIGRAPRAHPHAAVLLTVTELTRRLATS